MNQMKHKEIIQRYKYMIMIKIKKIIYIWLKIRNNSYKTIIIMLRNI
jgi:hypothetical protein